VITQRPTNVLKDIRSQIHIWHLCEKIFSMGNWVWFGRFTTEEMKDDLPVHRDEKGKLIGKRKVYFGSKRIFDAYNTHAFRDPTAEIRRASFEVYQYNRFQLLGFALRSFFRRPVRGNVDAPLKPSGRLKGASVSVPSSKPSLTSLRSILGVKRSIVSERSEPVPVSRITTDSLT
jgi:hypothetical protein